MNQSISLDSIPTREKAPVILDIDVFREDPFDPNDIAVWNVLEDLRGVKNRIFFESVTEKLLEGYR